MIESFSFKNYKAFTEGKIELKPITILLGANSVGKSSILQLLSMIKQTTNVAKKYKSALKLNGESVSLGEYKNIFHNQNIEEPLEISFMLKSIDMNSVKKELERTVENIAFMLERAIVFSNIHNSDLKKISLIQSGKRDDYPKLFGQIENFIQIINKALKENTENSKKIEDSISNIGGFRGRKLVEIGIDNKKRKKVFLNIKEYRKTYDFLNIIAKKIDKIDNLILNYHIICQDNDLVIDKLELKDTSNIIILSYEKRRVKGGNPSIITSNLVEAAIFKPYNNSFGNSIYFDRLHIRSHTISNEPTWNERQYVVTQNIFIETIFKIFRSATTEIQNAFENEKINYVSPLRAYPRRYYFLDEANTTSSLNTIDGNQLTEVLKENKSIKKMVNTWLEKFSLKVDVEQLADVIHNIKINQHGLTLDITDVGFGLSQILPVIVQGFLSKENSLTIIEQPEIHLHPKMQSDLADLFIDIVSPDISNNKNNKRLLIETHSEYLLKRLRRRIAEGKIKPTDVAIYFVHPKEEKGGSGNIEKLQISPTGQFNWPKDFYADDLEDTIEFLKHQE